jgi:hypothetical protein
MFWVKRFYKQVARKIIAESTMLNVMFSSTEIYLALTPEKIPLAVSTSRTMWGSFLLEIWTKSAILTASCKKLLFPSYSLRSYLKADTHVFQYCVCGSSA